MEQSERIVYEDDDAKVVAEVIDGLLFCHCFVKEGMSRDTLRKWKRWWAILKEEFYIVGWDELYTYTPNIRWCKLLDKDFEHVGTIDRDGKQIEVLKWVLTP